MQTSRQSRTFAGALALFAIALITLFASARSAPVEAAPGDPNLSADDVTTSEGNAGTTAFSVVISLDAPALAGGVTFDLAISHGTTDIGDLTPIVLTNQTIPETESFYSTDISITGDMDFELDETFIATVSNVTGAVNVVKAESLNRIVNDDDPDVCTVTSSDDTGVGALREKMADANCDRIEFDTVSMSSSTISLDTTLPSVTRELEIVGDNLVTVSGELNVLPFVVDVGGGLRLASLEIVDGRSAIGGAVYSEGHLLVEGSFFENNVSDGGAGMA